MKKAILALGTALASVPVVLADYGANYSADDIPDIAIDLVGSSVVENKPFIPIWILLFVATVVVGSVATVVAVIKGRRR